jgi:hypothetical protein
VKSHSLIHSITHSLIKKKGGKMNNYDTLSQAINSLKEKGYTEDFNLKADHLEYPAKKLKLEPENFTIDEFHRFEGMSNPADMSVVYAVSADDENIKGVLVDAYGTYAEKLNPKMAKKLEMDG